MKKIDYKALDDRCRSEIDCYDELVGVAWGFMDRMRCPFSMALPTLYDMVCEVAEEWAEENGIEYEEIDIEEIISA